MFLNDYWDIIPFNGKFHISDYPLDCESDGKFECYECEKKLKSMAQLQQHLSEVHDNEGVDGDDPSEVRSEGSQEDEREKQVKVKPCCEECHLTRKNTYIYPGISDDKL